MCKRERHVFFFLIGTRISTSGLLDDSLSVTVCVGFAFRAVLVLTFETEGGETDHIEWAVSKEV